MKKYLEVGTSKWTIVVEVDACGRCLSHSWGWWDRSLWQNPATGTVHVQRGARNTECGLELPKGTPEHRIHMAIKEVA